MIEEPRSLLLNERSLYSVFLIFEKYNSPRKIRIKTSSFRLFHNTTPAIDFPQTKDLVKGSQNFIKETVYQRPLNSAGWNYGGEKRRESTFNLETKNVFGILQKDHKSSSNRLSNIAETPLLDQATYRKVLNIKNSAEQSYSTLHLKLGLFQLQLKKRRKDRNTNIHKLFEEKHFGQGELKSRKTDAARCTSDIIWKRGCIKLSPIATLPKKQSDFAVLDAWTIFSETFDLISGARSTQNSKKKTSFS